MSERKETKIDYISGDVREKDDLCVGKKITVKIICCVHEQI